ncbi:MAG: HAD hydrolase family protein [Desulfobulbaceae bacterium]|nr:HAD hydrolase family protein [Desulfobulbaceae bacterium]HIJ90880.1 HAD hydrolase family protein [Deltaproteobacteria bacterium]
MTDSGTCGIPGGKYPSDCEILEGLRQRALARTEQNERGYVWRNCLPLAKEIRLLLLDVDGVLTDGSVVYAQSGTELKSFNTKDGFGIRLLQEAGVEVGLITARSSEAVQRRAQDLKLAHVYQGVRNKIEVFDRIIGEQKLSPKEVAYMGDDWLDLPLLSRVGLAVTTADAVAEVKAVVHYVSKREGGRGAVRELCDLIIEAKNLREELLGRYLR